jgi:hypothetical protein
VIIGWTIYDHPKDFPDKFAARMWVSVGGEVAWTDNVVLSEDVDLLRDYFSRTGRARFLRSSEDDPVIMESWI